MPLFALANAGVDVGRGLLADAAGLADHARHPVRLHRRQARRHPRRVLDRLAAAPGRASPHAQLAGAHGRRRRVGHRLHRLAADLHDRARRPAARRSEDRRAGRRHRRDASALAGHPRDPRAARRAAGAPDQRHRRGALDLTDDVDPERDHIRGPDGRARHADRVRRLRVPVLRTGRGGDPRAARLVRRRPALRLAPPAAQRRPRERPAGGRGGRGRGRARRVLGDARPAARAPGRAGPRRSRRHAEALGLDAERFRTTCARRARPRAWPTTSRARTAVACPARPRSSSTDAATTAHTTPQRSPPRSGRQGLVPAPSERPESRHSGEDARRGHRELPRRAGRAHARRAGRPARGRVAVRLGRAR